VSQSKLLERTLSSYIESLQSKGTYTFKRAQAIKALKMSSNAFQKAAKKLIDKQKLACLRTGFFVIVPTEYKSKGISPTSWFIHELMQFINKPYYVGLLSAAALHGAAHQQPQEYQIITTVPLKPINKKNSHIHFFTKRHFSKSLTQQIKTPTGYMTVSTPETTAFDLVQYAKSAGQIHHVATVLNELAENLSKIKLVQVARARVSLSVIQRLGYLLDLLERQDLTAHLYDYLTKQDPMQTRLRPEIPGKKTTYVDQKWNVLVNETIEVDE